MPWKESQLMDERLTFVARLLDGEKMTHLCREFGISRPTGYKIFKRYRDIGLMGLQDLSRRPWHHANRLPFQVESTILKLKKEKPHWGAPKLRERLIRRYPQLKPPATSTVHAVLDRHGLVQRRTRKRNKAQGTVLRRATPPNALWCADYKGEFRLGNHQYCYPLTITDYCSRYLFACEGLESTQEAFAFSVFERVFQEFGLPDAIRTDNGKPFSAVNAIHGLSRLSVWWLRLGIRIERIKPGNPQQNGRHERMHLTLKQEATQPAGDNFLQQQAKFDGFIDEYNNERPHQALDMQYPVERYRPSTRPYQPPAEPEYPYHDKVIRVSQDGKIYMHNKTISFSKVLAGQLVGIREIEDQLWLVSFLDYDFGYFDEEGCRVEPIDNPFAEQVLIMPSGKV